MRQSLTLALTTAALLLGGCSRLLIRTEIHDGKGLLRALTLEERVQEVADSLVRATTQFRQRALEQTVPVYADRWRVLKERFPTVFVGDEEDRVASISQVLSGQLIAPVESRMYSLTHGALALRDRLRTPGNAARAEVVESVRNLQRDLLQIRDYANARITEIADQQQRDALDAVAEHFAARTDELADELKRITGLPTASDQQYRIAVEEAKRLVRLDTGGLALAMEQAALQPIGVAQDSAEASFSMSLGDPNLPRVVGDDGDRWRKYANEVSSTTWLGATNVIVRMQNIGQYHIKENRSDHSEVMRAAIGTAALGVKIFGAMYGVPVPTGTGDAAQTTAMQSRVQIEAELERIAADREVRLAHMSSLFDVQLGLARRLREARAANDEDAIAAIRSEAMSAVTGYAKGIVDARPVQK